MPHSRGKVTIPSSVPLNPNFEVSKEVMSRLPYPTLDRGIAL